MDLDQITIAGIISLYEKKKYSLFTKGNYNLNIFGIRAYPGQVNKFDDVIGMIYKVNEVWHINKYAGTTDPGLYYLKEPMNVSGTAILKEGQYKGAFKIGMHQGKYEALVQNKPLPVYRDADRDTEHDFDEKTLQTGMFGINIHRATGIAGASSVQVDKWSAGCQVIAAYNDFQEFMSLVNTARKNWGSTFTYTLFNQKDFCLS